MPPLSILLRCLLVLASICALPAAAQVATDVEALLARNDASGALRAADAALVAKPRDPQARFARAVVLMALARDEEALDAFTSFTQEYPELPEPYNNIALLQARAGRLEQARQSLETALRNDPGHRAARANLGEVNLMLAVKAWEQAAASGPPDARLLRRLDAARALLAAGVTPAR